MKNYSIFYFCDNIIYYLENINTEVIKFNLPKNTMKSFRIINYKNIEKYLGRLFLSNKIVNLFTIKKVKIIMPIEYSDCEKDLLKKIFYDYNFNIIEYIYEAKIFNDYKNKYYINIQDNNMLLHQKKHNKIISLEIYNSEDLYKYINRLIFRKNKELFIYGNHKRCLFNNIEKLYFYDTEIDFLLKKVYKMKK